MRIGSNTVSRLQILQWAWFAWLPGVGKAFFDSIEIRSVSLIVGSTRTRGGCHQSPTALVDVRRDITLEKRHITPTERQVGPRKLNSASVDPAVYWNEDLKCSRS